MAHGGTGPSVSADKRLDDKALGGGSTFLKLRVVSPTSFDGRVAIVGGGIIGCSTAYFLNLMGAVCDVFEGTGIASSSSGKAGGFLAKDWCSGPVDELARCSFDLHSELAGELGSGQIGYRRTTTASVSTAPKPAKRHTQAPVSDGLPGWFCSAGSSVLPVGSGPLGDASTTAQVHPARLTCALAERATQAGCTVIQQQVVAVEALPGVSLRSGAAADSAAPGTPQYTITTQGGQKHGPFSAVVLATGAWIECANAWLPGVVPFGWRNVKVHSVVLQAAAAAATSCTATCAGSAGQVAVDSCQPSPHPGAQATSQGTVCLQEHPRALPATMLFVHDGEQGLEPEVYPRPCGEVYSCDISSDTPVPETPAEVQPDAGSCEKLEKFLRGLGGGLDDTDAFPLKAAQACYLPYAPGDQPIIGPSDVYPGVFIGAGHNCWGILLGPATGLLLAHQVLQQPVHFLSKDTVQSLAPGSTNCKKQPAVARAEQAVSQT